MHITFVMEYAIGGEIFEPICSSERFMEDEVSLTFRDETL